MPHRWPGELAQYRLGVTGDRSTTRGICPAAARPPPPMRYSRRTAGVTGGLPSGKAAIVSFPDYPMARRIYKEASVDRRGEKKRRLAQLLSMSYDTIDRWLARIDKDTKEERDAAVQDLYLQCYTQEEIAERVGVPLGSLNDKFLEIRKYGIPGIAGLHTEDMPEDGATEKVMKASALNGKS